MSATSPLPATVMLEVKPAGSLSTDYSVLVDGNQLTTVGDTRGPFSAAFTIARVDYFVRLHHRTRTGWGLLAGVLRGVVGRGEYALSLADRDPLMLARSRGLAASGYDIEFANARAELRWSEHDGEYHWLGDDGSRGRIARSPTQRRGVLAQLPAALSTPQQVFLALLGLARWEVLSTGSG